MRKKNLAWTGMKVRAFDRMKGRDIFTWNPYNPQKPSLIDMFLLYFLLYLLSSYLFCACLSPCREGRDLGVFYTALQGATLDTAPDFAPIYPPDQNPPSHMLALQMFGRFCIFSIRPRTILASQDLERAKRLAVPSVYPCWQGLIRPFNQLESSLNRRQHRSQ